MKSLTLTSMDVVDPRQIAEIRAFSRFYTSVMGLLDQGLLQSKLTLTEARVIFELAHSGQTDVSDVRSAMKIDGAHLSRILSRFDAAGLVTRTRSADDGRRQVVQLTEDGREAFATVNERSDEQARRLLETLMPHDRGVLLASLRTVRSILGDVQAPATAAVVIRPLGAGDLGWVVERHGALYAEEYGWDQTFEALVAKIVADYGASHDPTRENAWIAELNGVRAGCIFCVRKDDGTAQLRLLLVDPSARGHGIGPRLVDECVRFARLAGYREVTLWTNDVLTAARRIYERAGFELADEDKHHSFGHDLVGQNWSLELVK